MVWILFNLCQPMNEASIADAVLVQFYYDMEVWRFGVQGAIIVFKEV